MDAFGIEAGRGEADLAATGGGGEAAVGVAVFGGCWPGGWTSRVI